MKCPLFTAAEIAHEPEFLPSSKECLKEECAWWSSACNQCSMPALAEELHWVAERLQAIAEGTKRSI